MPDRKTASSSIDEDSKLSFLIIFAFTTIVISKELSSRFSSKVEVPTVEVKSDSSEEMKAAAELETKALAIRPFAKLKRIQQ